MISATELLQAHNDALSFMSNAVLGVANDAWGSSSPCEKWSVRDVVNHITSENLWTGPLMDGKTVDEVGDRFDGDVLGSDPPAAWAEAAKVASNAFASEDALSKTVYVSFGDISAKKFLEQMTADLVIHGWDTLKGSGQNDTIPLRLVAVAMRIIEPAVASGETASVFKDPVEVDARADAQTKLLALTGRVRGEAIS